VARELGGTAEAFGCDIGDGAGVDDVVRRVARLGPLRVAVVTAGVSDRAPTIDRSGDPQPDGHFARLVRINVFGTFNVLRSAAAVMASNDPMNDGERGVIVLTASIAAFEGQAGQLAYAATKAAVVGMTLPAALDLSRVGIRVVTIAPGLFETPMVANTKSSTREGLDRVRRFPHRWGQPEEYGILVEQIIDNPMLNGTTIRLDGALRLPSM